MNGFDIKLCLGYATSFSGKHPQNGSQSKKLTKKAIKYKLIK